MRSRRKGTTFKVYFPLTDKSPRPTPPIRVDAVRGTETILLVEDEEQVRTVARGILERYGYDVFEAHDGHDALRIARDASKPIDLLLTDVVMPTMGGRDLAESLTRDRPAMRVLFMSGYTDEATGAHGVLAAGVALLQKPFTPKTLLRRVREVLDGPGS